MLSWDVATFLNADESAEITIICFVFVHLLSGFSYFVFWIKEIQEDLKLSLVGLAHVKSEQMLNLFEVFIGLFE